MPKPKKTILVESIRTEVNRLLTLDTLDQKQKSILCSFLERVLMDTNNYHGFNYTYWLNQGFEEWRKDGEPGFPKKQKYLGNEYDRTYYK